MAQTFEFPNQGQKAPESPGYVKESSDSPDYGALNLPENYAIYAGNVGSINNPMLLFNAAKYLKEKIGNKIYILVVGDGQDKEKIKEISKDQKIDNLLFLDLLSKKEVAFLLKKSIASIIPLKGSSYLDCSSPNKLFEAFAAGTPVIQTTNGWIKNYLNIHKIGYTIGEDDFRELAEKIIYLKNNIQIRNEINRKAKKISNCDFDKKILSQKMIDNILFNIS